MSCPPALPPPPRKGERSTRPMTLDDLRALADAQLQFDAARRSIAGARMFLPSFPLLWAVVIIIWWASLR